MNKAELIESLAQEQGMSKAEAGRALEVILKNISDALVAGSSVALPGFGSFQVKTRAARQGRNPQTGETIQIAEKHVAGFKPAKALTDALN